MKRFCLRKLKNYFILLYFCIIKYGVILKWYLSNETFFGKDMIQIEGLSEKVTEYLDAIRKEGMEAALKHFFG